MIKAILFCPPFVGKDDPAYDCSVYIHQWLAKHNLHQRIACRIAHGVAIPSKLEAFKLMQNIDLELKVNSPPVKQVFATLPKLETAIELEGEDPEAPLFLAALRYLALRVGDALCLRDGGLETVSNLLERTASLEIADDFPPGAKRASERACGPHGPYLRLFRQWGDDDWVKFCPSVNYRALADDLSDLLQQHRHQSESGDIVWTDDICCHLREHEFIDAMDDDSTGDILTSLATLRPIK